MICTWVGVTLALSWAYWPYKKMDDPKGTMNFKMPDNYSLVITYAKNNRSIYENMRKPMPDRVSVQKALNEFVEQSIFKNNFENKGYIEGPGLKSGLK